MNLSGAGRPGKAPTPGMALRRVISGMLRRYGKLEIGMIPVQALLLVGSVISARALGAQGRGALAIVTVWGQTIGWSAGVSVDRAIISERYRDSRLTPELALTTVRWFAACAGFVAAVAFMILFRGTLSSATLVAGCCVALLTPLYECVGSAALARQAGSEYLGLRIVQAATTVIVASIALLLVASGEVGTVAATSLV